MTKPPDFDSLVDALRTDLPSDAERERTRARLVASGVAVGAGAGIAAPSTVAAASSVAKASAVAGSAHSAVLGQVAGLSLSAKLGVLAIVVAAGAGVPIATHIREQSARSAAVIAHAAQASDTRIAAPMHVGHAVAHAQTPANTAAPQLAIATPSAQRRVSVDTSTSAARAARTVPAPTVLAAARARADEPAANKTAVSPSALVTPAAALPTAATPVIAAAAATSPAATPVTAATPTPTPKPAPSTLRDEADLIARALSALRAGDREGARAALAAHAQRYPHGMLARERERVARRIDGGTASAVANP